MIQIFNANVDIFLYWLFETKFFKRNVPDQIVLDGVYGCLTQFLEV